jgi:sulfofructose kinase
MHSAVDELAAVSMVDVVGLGLNAFDTIVVVPRFPASGEKVRIVEAVRCPGGQVATAMIACGGWGLRARYIGSVGDDEAGRVHQQEFQTAGVEAHLLVKPGVVSQFAYILVDQRTGERTIFWQRDERLAVPPSWLRRAWVERARLLHLDGHDPAAAVQAARWARAAGIPVVADLDNFYPGMEELLPLVDYLLAAEEFPARVLGPCQPERALEELRRRFGHRVAGVTLGARGAMVLSEEGLLRCPGYPVQAVDTTGAGDVFHAGFIYGLLQHWPIVHCLEFACAAAALNCTALGARGGVRPVNEILAFIKAAGRSVPPVRNAVRQKENAETR